MRPVYRLLLCGAGAGSRLLQRAYISVSHWQACMPRQQLGRGSSFGWFARAGYERLHKRLRIQRSHTYQRGDRCPRLSSLMRYDDGKPRQLEYAVSCTAYVRRGRPARRPVSLQLMTHTIVKLSSCLVLATYVTRQKAEQATLHVQSSNLVQPYLSTACEPLYAHSAASTPAS